MKGFFEGVAVILLATVIMAAIPTEAEGKIYEDTVRLHILAHSDNEEDQKVKIYIRDSLLSTYGEVLSGYENADAAAEAMEELLPRVREVARAWSDIISEGIRDEELEVFASVISRMESNAKRALEVGEK